MNYDRITTIARKLKRGCDTRHASELCDYLDIWLSYLAMGKDDNSIKGFITTNSRCATITLNSDYPEEVQNIVCFHEIGHYILRHRQPNGMLFFHDATLFNNASHFEEEANTFAAAYLLDDDRTIEVLKSAADYFTAASILHVPKAILNYKMRLLTYYGKINDCREFPITVTSDCMGKFSSTILKNDDY